MVTTRCTSLEPLEVCARQVYGTIEPQRSHHVDLEEADLPPHCMLACKKPANQVPGGAIHMRGPPFAAAGSAERCLHMAGCNGLRQLEREEEEEKRG